VSINKVKEEKKNTSSLILVSKPAIEIECNKDQKSVSARNKKIS
jgi:hypothetical protein